jgi:hypothetical protein
VDIIAHNALGDMINGLRRAFVPRTVSAAIEGAVGLDTVADDFTTTVLTDGGEFVDGAFETIKHMPHPRRDDLKRQVVVIAADFTRCHR